MSEWAVKTAEKLLASEGGLRDEAAAMLAVKAIGSQLYGWDKEPSLQEMELARTTGAVNLRLINTSPQRLAILAGAKAKADDYRDGQ